MLLITGNYTDKLVPITSTMALHEKSLASAGDFLLAWKFRQHSEFAKLFLRNIGVLGISH